MRQMAHAPNGTRAKWYRRQMAHTPFETSILPSIRPVRILKIRFRVFYRTKKSNKYRAFVFYELGRVTQKRTEVNYY
jgi:hypothetical protein